MHKTNPRRLGSEYSVLNLTTPRRRCQLVRVEKVVKSLGHLQGDEPTRNSQASPAFRTEEKARMR